ncbi:hypothetical protein B0T10DRAFT_552810 [Thelonectria olida]|uniref:Uncharacterized protein n=1 Tax=Thelonectria olida TaxID=1576542 RepID=A0A9P9ALH4_9HYPO|nr:hypothetical protein B0T10DRAFT_552810 [Thelonectria olida]
MPKSKYSHSPALVDEPPSKRRSNHVSWANARKNSKQADNIDASKRPRIFQHGYAWDGRSSPSEDLFGNGDEHQLGDCFSVGGYSNSVTDLRGNNITTPHNFIDLAPQLFNESIGGEIQASPTENYSNILANSIPSAAVMLDLRKKLLGTTYPVIIVTTSGDLQSAMAEVRAPANSMSEANSESPVTGDSGIWWQESRPHSAPVEQENLEVLQKLAIRGPSNNHSQGIKPTASKKQRQHIGKADQIDKLWRDRNHIHKAVHELGKLEDRLQGWNKHQMDAVQETSTHHSGRYQQEAEKIKITGASGYIGGDLLHLLAKVHPEYTVRALVRNAGKGEAISRAFRSRRAGQVVAVVHGNMTKSQYGHNRGGYRRKNMGNLTLCD